jgi:ElaB/YqjD/DUF883 family membrane-anchored ribosome-binding protein
VQRAPSRFFDTALGLASGAPPEPREVLRRAAGETRAEQETLGFLRENAMPLALIGIGAAWFVSKSRQREARWNAEYGPREYGHWRYPEQSSGSHPIQGAREGLSRAAGGAREFASHAKERAQHWVEGAEHKASDVADKARSVAERELRDARDYSRHTVETHPLAVGAAAVVAGIGIGLLLPATRSEKQLLGSGSNRLVSEAKEAVQDWTHTAKEAARDVKDTLAGHAGPG